MPSRNVEESFGKFLDPDPQVDYFENSTNFSLSTDTFLVKDPISSSYAKSLIGRQTNKNRQLNAG